MEIFFEAVMVSAMCVAVGILLCRFAANKSIHLKRDRFTVITMGIGFVFGGICKALIDPIPWILGLYIVGALLCYCAAVFSFPGKEEAAHE